MGACVCPLVELTTSFTLTLSVKTYGIHTISNKLQCVSVPCGSGSHNMNNDNDRWDTAVFFFNGNLSGPGWSQFDQSTLGNHNIWVVFFLHCTPAFQVLLGFFFFLAYKICKIMMSSYIISGQSKREKISSQDSTIYLALIMFSWPLPERAQKLKEAEERAKNRPRVYKEPKGKSSTCLKLENIAQASLIHLTYHLMVCVVFLCTWQSVLPWGWSPIRSSQTSFQPLPCPSIDLRLSGRASTCRYTTIRVGLLWSESLHTLQLSLTYFQALE